MSQILPGTLSIEGMRWGLVRQKRRGFE
ncbi:hypothetical protein CBM2585_A130398 [Cupriavidus taiwanensis]|nr:hypothetical protein CBM2585_A130398 [Cupriavidus taiwanensis]SOZ05669.1 hypothetical protein CBM2595_A80354 [Cupriavidus taiwanensis]SOZ07653.1 hypothetical protein CBM2597_A90259 [Cupriavidus taiwanensis]